MVRDFFEGLLRLIHNVEFVCLNKNLYNKFVSRIAVKKIHINGRDLGVSETEVWLLGTEEGSYPVYQSRGLKTASEIKTLIY